MGIEIERKFLVASDAWRGAVESRTEMVQGYLATTERVTLRVRIQDETAILGVKGPVRGLARSEYEYPVPLADARAMMAELSIAPPVEKTRYRVRHGRHVWDLDCFEGANAGLVVAEIELASPNERFDLPPWAGREVTGDPRYSNANLARYPFVLWRDSGG